MSDALPLARAVAPSPLEGEEGYHLIDDPWGIAPEGLAVPGLHLLTLSLCDGTRTLEDIQSGIVVSCGSFIPLASVQRLVEELAEVLLIESPASEVALAERRAAYRAGARPATLADQCYPSDPAELARRLDQWLSETGSFDAPPGAVGIVAPHIDPERGHGAYAPAYRALSEHVEADTFIILGVHHGPASGLYTLTRQDHETPLGTLPVAREVADRLEEATAGSSATDELLHLTEHSIELQTIWLRHVRPEARIVPVLCRKLDGGNAFERQWAARFAEELSALVGEGCGLIVGADLTHVGPAFGHPPRAVHEVLPWSSAVDRAVLEATLAGDAEAVLVEAERASPRGEEPHVCGQPALYAAARALGPTSGQLLALERAPAEVAGSWVGFGAGLLYGPEV